MENVKLIKNIKTVYTEIVKRLIKPSWEFPQGGKPEKTISQFLQTIEKRYGTVSNGRIVEFCVYTLHRLKDDPYLLSSNGISKSFGKTSIQKYEEAVRGSKYYMEQWLLSKDLTIKYLTELIVDKTHHPQEKYMYMPSEEVTKKRFLNSDLGYILCQQSTLGWSHLSPTCQQCQFDDDCKKDTNRKFPELYRLRIEHEQNNR